MWTPLSHSFYYDIYNLLLHVFCICFTELGSLPTFVLIQEVKKLHDLAYQLGLDEANEMTRGKYLNIFKSRKQR